MANDLVPSFWTFIYLIEHFWCGVLSLPMAIYHTDCSFIIPLHLLSFVTWSSGPLTLKNILRYEISPPDTIYSQNLGPKTTYPTHPGSALKLGSDTKLTGGTLRKSAMWLVLPILYLMLKWNCWKYVDHFWWRSFCNFPCVYMNCNNLWLV